MVASFLGCRLAAPRSRLHGELESRPGCGGCRPTRRSSARCRRRAAAAWRSARRTARCCRRIDARLAERHGRAAGRGQRDAGEARLDALAELQPDLGSPTRPSPPTAGVAFSSCACANAAVAARAKASAAAILTIVCDSWLTSLGDWFAERVGEDVVEEEVQLADDADPVAARAVRSGTIASSANCHLSAI